MTWDPCPVGGAKEKAGCATGSSKQSVLCEMKQFPSAHRCAWGQVFILLLRVGVLSSASPLLCRMPEVLSFLLLCLWSRTPQWKSSCLCPSGLLERVVGWWVCAGLITQPPNGSTALVCPTSASLLSAPASRARPLSVVLCERSLLPGWSLCLCVPPRCGRSRRVPQTCSRGRKLFGVCC